MRHRVTSQHTHHTKHIMTLGGEASCGMGDNFDFSRELISYVARKRSPKAQLRASRTHSSSLSFQTVFDFLPLLRFHIPLKRPSRSSSRCSPPLPPHSAQSRRRSTSPQHGWASPPGCPDWGLPRLTDSERWPPPQPQPQMHVPLSFPPPSVEPLNELMQVRTDRESSSESLQDIRLAEQRRQQEVQMQRFQYLLQLRPQFSEQQMLPAPPPLPPPQPPLLSPRAAPQQASPQGSVDTEAFLRHLFQQLIARPSPPPPASSPHTPPLPPPPDDIAMELDMPPSVAATPGFASHYPPVPPAPPAEYTMFASAPTAFSPPLPLPPTPPPSPPLLQPIPTGVQAAPGMFAQPTVAPSATSLVTRSIFAPTPATSLIPSTRDPAVAPAPPPPPPLPPPYSPSRVASPLDELPDDVTSPPPVSPSAAPSGAAAVLPPTTYRPLGPPAVPPGKRAALQHAALQLQAKLSALIAQTGAAVPVVLPPPPPPPPRQPPPPILAADAAPLPAPTPTTPPTPPQQPLLQAPKQTQQPPPQHSAPPGSASSGSSVGAGTAEPAHNPWQWVAPSAAHARARSPPAAPAEGAAVPRASSPVRTSLPAKAPARPTDVLCMVDVAAAAAAALARTTAPIAALPGVGGTTATPPTGNAAAPPDAMAVAKKIAMMRQRARTTTVSASASAGGRPFATAHPSAGATVGFPTKWRAPIPAAAVPAGGCLVVRAADLLAEECGEGEGEGKGAAETGTVHTEAGAEEAETAVQGGGSANAEDAVATEAAAIEAEAEAKSSPCAKVGEVASTGVEREEADQSTEQQEPPSVSPSTAAPTTTSGAVAGMCGDKPASAPGEASLLPCDEAHIPQSASERVAEGAPNTSSGDGVSDAASISAARGVSDVAAAAAAACPILTARPSGTCNRESAGLLPVLSAGTARSNGGANEVAQGDPSPAGTGSTVGSAGAGSEGKPNMAPADEDVSEAQLANRPAGDEVPLACDKRPPPQASPLTANGEDANAMPEAAAKEGSDWSKDRELVDQLGAGALATAGPTAAAEERKSEGRGYEAFAEAMARPDATTTTSSAGSDAERPADAVVTDTKPSRSTDSAASPATPIAGSVDNPTTVTTAENAPTPALTPVSTMHSQAAKPATSAPVQEAPHAHLAISPSPPSSTLVDAGMDIEEGELAAGAADTSVASTPPPQSGEALTKAQQRSAGRRPTTAPSDELEEGELPQTASPASTKAPVQGAHDLCSHGARTQRGGTRGSPSIGDGDSTSETSSLSISTVSDVGEAAPSSRRAPTGKPHPSAKPRRSGPRGRATEHNYTRHVRKAATHAQQRHAHLRSHIAPDQGEKPAGTRSTSGGSGRSDGTRCAAYLGASDRVAATATPTSTAKPLVPPPLWLHSRNDIEGPGVPAESGMDVFRRPAAASASGSSGISMFALPRYGSLIPPPPIAPPAALNLGAALSAATAAAAAAFATHQHLHPAAPNPPIPLSPPQLPAVEAGSLHTTPASAAAAEHPVAPTAGPSPSAPGVRSQASFVFPPPMNASGSQPSAGAALLPATTPSAAARASPPTGAAVNEADERRAIAAFLNGALPLESLLAMPWVSRRGAAELRPLLERARAAHLRKTRGGPPPAAQSEAPQLLQQQLTGRNPAPNEAGPRACKYAC